MSRSHFKRAKEIPIGADILPGNVMRARWKQCLVHRKPPQGHGGRKLGKTMVRFPPPTGWPGGSPESNGLGKGT